MLRKKNKKQKKQNMRNIVEFGDDPDFYSTIGEGTKFVILIVTMLISHSLLVLVHVKEKKIQFTPNINME